MPLNIKDAETDRLVRELAKRTGTSITEAIKTAVTHELGRTPDFTPEQIAQRRRALDAIIDRGRQLPVLDERSADEILGYDEHGLPS